MKEDEYINKNIYLLDLNNNHKNRANLSNCIQFKRNLII